MSAPPDPTSRTSPSIPRSMPRTSGPTVRAADDYRAGIQAWMASAGRVARRMTSIFAAALGLPTEHFVPFTDHSIDVLRMNHYDVPAGVEVGESQMGMGAHTDYGIVTVLWADPVPGLEILRVDGSWLPVQPAPGALLINLGDLPARWTNDRWLSTMHRVVPPRDAAGALVRRRSAAFFHDGNADAVISTLDPCRAADGSSSYDEVTVGEHLAQKLGGSRGLELNAHAEREASRIRDRVPPRPDDRAAPSDSRHAVDAHAVAEVPLAHRGSRHGRRRGELRAVELGVLAVECEEFVVRALLDDAAVVEHDDRVGGADGRQPVGDHQGGPSVQRRVERGLHGGFGTGVEARCRLVEHDDARIAQQHPGDREPLALAAGEPVAALADDGVESVGQRCDEQRHLGAFERSPQFLVGRARPRRSAGCWRSCRGTGGRPG